MPAEGGQAGVDAGPRGEGFHEGMEGGDQPEVVEDGGTELAGELLDEVDRFFDEALGAGDVEIEAPGLELGLLLERGQPDGDAREGLGDDVVELAADFLTLFFLGGKDLAGEMPEFLLLEVGLRQELGVMEFASLQGLFGLLSLGDFSAQLQVGGGQLDGAMAERGDEPFQLGGRFLGVGRGAGQAIG